MRLFVYSSVAGLLAVGAVWGSPGNVWAWACAVVSIALAMVAGHLFNLSILDEAAHEKDEANALLARALEASIDGCMALEKTGHELAKRAHLLEQYEASLESLRESLEGAGGRSATEALMLRVEALEAENARLRAA